MRHSAVGGDEFVGEVRCRRDLRSRLVPFVQLDDDTFRLDRLVTFVRVMRPSLVLMVTESPVCSTNSTLVIPGMRSHDPDVELAEILEGMRHVLNVAVDSAFALKPN